MNKAKYCFLLLFYLTSIVVSSQEIASLKQLEIDSEILNQKRSLLIYTPKEYEERNLVAFDVIYVFDSQHRELFDLVHSIMSFASKRQFIVVGIASTSFPETEYYRNSDFLPNPVNVELKNYRTQKPNAENFWEFVKTEVFTYIHKNYRTTNRKFAIGHSLSASFVLDKAINESLSFTGYISISPNLAYDLFRLPNDFEKFNFISDETKFLYISQANELSSWDEDWNIGYEKIKSHVAYLDATGDYQIQFNEFPNQNHWNTYPVALNDALIKLSSFIENHQLKPRGEFREVNITVRVPDKNDEAFIAGNQSSLGNWDASKIKLVKTSDYERRITLKVQFPIEFKITRGSWDSQAFTDQTTNDGENIVINYVDGNVINLKVNVWNDRQF